MLHRRVLLHVLYSRAVNVTLYINGCKKKNTKKVSASKKNLSNGFLKAFIINFVSLWNEIQQAEGNGLCEKLLTILEYLGT